MDSKELHLFLFVQHPQIGNAYVTEGIMTLKYRSKSEFLGKTRLRLIRLSLLTNPLELWYVFGPRKLVVNGYT